MVMVIKPHPSVFLAILDTWGGFIPPGGGFITRKGWFYPPGFIASGAGFIPPLGRGGITVVVAVEEALALSWSSK